MTDARIAPKPAFARATWAPARKDMAGCSLGSARLWFTLAEGVVTEVYHPRIDIPQIRDLGFIVADDAGFWVEVRQANRYEVSLSAPGVPAVQVVHRHDRFTLTLRVCPAQNHDVLLVSVELEGDEGLRPYVLLAPRLGGEAETNLAWAAMHNGRQTLWAEQGPFGLALCAVDAAGADGFFRTSAGCSQESDGWTDFSRHGRLTELYDMAGPAAVALTGELSRTATLALGFSASREAAATLALSVLALPFEAAWAAQTRVWTQWLERRGRPELDADLHRVMTVSATMLMAHQDRTFRGAAVASLSVPWGDSSQSRGGYHLVWPRDLVETAGALVAFGALHEAREVLQYLMATQQPDGRWFQNQWLGGSAFWSGVQLDETAFPVLLAAMLKDRGALDGIDPTPMVSRALSFIAREGPASEQDRWEEDAGVNGFTVAVVIAALVEGADFLQEPARGFALKVADGWNARIEDWIFAPQGPLCGDDAVDGYYVRTSPVEVLLGQGSLLDQVPIKNLAVDAGLAANAQVATDFLQLVRFGLRSPHDPAVLSTLKVVDQHLKVSTPYGPVWRRYNGDGYGEHVDGAPFDGVGCGRAWPLLTGERGHYAVAAGEDPTPYLESMAAMSSSLGLLPEQVWDAADIEARGLRLGRPSGSAMPLLWAHAEFVKLCYSRAAGTPVDRPLRTAARYSGGRCEVAYDIWGASYRPRRLRAGHSLVLTLKAPAVVRWGVDGWRGPQDVDAVDTGLGVWSAELPLETLKSGQSVQFTFRWLESGAWEGADYALDIVPA